MPLRIAIDTRRLADFGIGTYIRNLVRSLSKLDDRNQYTLISASAKVPEFEGLPNNFQTAHFDGKTKTGYAQLRYTMFLRKFDVDLYHIPLNAVPLWMPKPYL